ncbi:flagellar basal body P-ring formation protein FlgA [Methylobacillus caricis]|uniref:flagellar basal body P-ring formation chaperone FlgA n=1 Tax=Methylobacillus caricis TaxID=1971611 RepID=UPI001CFF7109|nr:flagellar basal body P-ring formation chaperone FlgA [Methylobacillus caricis]MCB5187984.1 flagellar basal body P-ring formation protein FlgA [Methylobacillus caricis]
MKLKQYAGKLVAAFCSLTLCSSLLGVTPVYAQTASQDLTLIRQKVEDFLLAQSAGYPGKVSVSAVAIDSRLKLADCASMQMFLPHGSRAWGRTSVGVRCNAPSVWTVYVQANVQVMADYLIAAAPLVQGHIITERDLATNRGDLAKLPPGIFTDSTQAVGMRVGLSLSAGTVLRQEMLRITPVVQQGQKVILSSAGRGFSISAEGTALGNAGEGQRVKVKVANGQVVSGLARQGGQIEVVF